MEAGNGNGNGNGNGVSRAPVALYSSYDFSLAYRSMMSSVLPSTSSEKKAAGLIRLGS